MDFTLRDLHRLIILLLLPHVVIFFLPHVVIFFLPHVLLFLVPSTDAQSIPTCLDTCGTSLIPTLTTCASADFHCVCAHEAFKVGMATCLQKSCNTDEKEVAINFARQICAANGVSLPKDIFTSAMVAATATSRMEGNGTATSMGLMTTPTPTAKEESFGLRRRRSRWGWGARIVAAVSGMVMGYFFW